MRAGPRSASICLVFFALAACSQTGSGEPTPTPTLLPYRTSTSTITPEGPPQPTGTEQSLLPSPTPFVHEIAEGETLLAIALRYGVAFEDLLASNPGVDPRFLSIGQKLRIPGPEGQPLDTLLPTSTPVPLQSSSQRCYPTANRGAWCILTLANDSESSVEGLAAELRVVAPDGTLVERGLAYSPLNVLPPDRVMPLAYYVEPPAPAGVTASFSLISAIGSGAAGERYVDSELEDLDLGPSGAEDHWRASGTMRVVEPTEGSSYRVSILVMALDSQGETVGFTKWQPDTTTSGPWPFQIEVFSLGPPIDHLELLREVVPSS